MLVSNIKSEIRFSPALGKFIHDRGAFRKWEPKTKRGETLFYHHPSLMKWDWDIPDSSHTASAVTIQSREEALEIIKAHPWASKQSWGFVDSWGGINAYNLSSPFPLHLMPPKDKEKLGKIMTQCRVDPFYIRNVHAERWSWCSRVWPKGWRPDEVWTGRFHCIYYGGPPPRKDLMTEFMLVKSMYDVFN